MKDIAIGKTPLLTGIVSLTLVGAGCAGAQLARPDNVDAVKHYAGAHKHQRSIAPPAKRSPAKASPRPVSLSPEKLLIPARDPSRRRSLTLQNSAATYAVIARNHMALARIHSVIGRAFIRCFVAHRVGAGLIVQRSCLELAQRISLRRTKRGWVVEIGGGQEVWVRLSHESAKSARVSTVLSRPGTMLSVGGRAPSRWTSTHGLHKWTLPPTLYHRLQY